MTTLQALPTIPSLPALGKPPTAVTTPVTRDEIEWAKKLDKKMEYGFVPDAAEQARYNKVVSQLQSIKDGGGYVYQDTTSFSNNPRGFSAIGSLVGRTLSGGYIGYRYGGEVATITHTTYSAVKAGIVGGNFGEAFKGLAGGLKQTGIISLKAGGISSAINAGTSLFANVFETISGRQTAKEAVGNVASDTVGGFLSGVGATAFSGMASLGVTLAGAGSLPITIAAVAGGVVGSLLLDKAYKASGLFTLLKSKITKTLE
jgi:hypothetical protein